MVEIFRIFRIWSLSIQSRQLHSFCRNAKPFFANVYERFRQSAPICLNNRCEKVFTEPFYHRTIYPVLARL